MRRSAICSHVRQMLYAAMSAGLARPQDKAPRADDGAAVVDALDCLRVAITVFDCDERLVYANEHFVYMFRSLPPLHDLVGRRYDELIRLEIAGGDIAALHEGVESYVAKRRAQLFARDYGSRDIPLADGRIIEIKTRRTPSLGWIALWSDVTEARRSLERLHTTIAMSADAFAFFDRYDRLTLCNAEYAELSAASSPSDLIGRSFSEIIAHAGNTCPPVGNAQAIQEKRNEIHRQPAGAMTVALANGRAYLVRDRACGDDGRIVVCTDVTEHHRAELALAEQTRTLDATRKVLAATKAQSQAQENYLADLATKLDQTEASADNTKKTLLRTMSHELKTPLNAIIGFSDLLSVLADQAGPDQIREYAGLINLGGKNLLRLLNQILDLTRISAGRYELNRQPLDVGLALWAAKDRFDGTASEKTITIDCTDAVPGIMAEADESAVTALLGHLVENAVGFTQPGGVVRLSVEATKDTLRLIVADNGPGIATEELARIVEPFEQGGRSTHDHPAGGGLGLTLAKAYCELHGGTLTLHSAPGQGFTAIAELTRAE